MYIYKDTFKQFALPQSNSPLLYSLDNKYQNNGYLYKHSLKFCQKQPQCFAYPWWKMALVKQQEKIFDIMLANGNIGSFPESALFEYLMLADTILKDDGVVFANSTLNDEATINRVFNVAKDAGFAILMFHRGNHINYFNLDKLESLHNEAVVLAPASESIHALLEDKNFTQKFSKIYLYDDFKKGAINGYPILSFEEIKELGLRNVLFCDDKNTIKNTFKEKFKEFNFIPLSCRRLHSSCLALIKKTHPLFEMCNARTYNFYSMPSGISELDKIFSGYDNLTEYYANDLLQHLKTSIN